MGIVSEMCSIIESELQLDATCSEKIVQTLQRYYGGIPVYLPKIKTDLETRNAKIWQKFTGNNHAQLCREFNLSYQQVCRIIEIQRKRNNLTRSMDCFVSVD
jgi:Mor family transcriptional regulator